MEGVGDSVWGEGRVSGKAATGLHLGSFVVLPLARVSEFLQLL